MYLFLNLLTTVFIGISSIASANPTEASKDSVGLAKQPSNYPPLAPKEGEQVAVNPPSMVWQYDKRAASYAVEFSRDAEFKKLDTRVTNLSEPFYNHSEVFAPGTWYWRHFLVTKEKKLLGPSPVKSFVVTKEAIKQAVPPTRDILASLPDHPRVYVTPETLKEFQALRKGPAKSVWETIKTRADAIVKSKPRKPAKLLPLKENMPSGRTPNNLRAQKKNEPTRRQVIWLLNGKAYRSSSYSYRHLNGDASRASLLSFAWLISGDEAYAQAAKEYLLVVSNARIDYHLSLKQRSSHDSVVYCYENGLKDAALTYDRIYDFLNEAERKQVREHVAYHGKAVYHWLHDSVKIHLNYQSSHAQQAMHPFLTTMLAVGNEFPEAGKWLDYLLRQYSNRIAWTSPDGGYFEGQLYSHKFNWILEALLAMRSATGIDLFKQPKIANSGEFWLYAMNLNYWYQHGGDIYSLISPVGSAADGFISNLLAELTKNPYVKWYSQTILSNPYRIPFQYLSETGRPALPPVDIPQAKSFPQTGVVSAYDKFYDHQSSRIFFRSSPKGSQSHAHEDQNSFVIHSGAEILAADVGYYTYYGDDYHARWSRSTAAHNSILVNGRGQPRSADSSGKISSFFDTPDYTFFSGDASAAYAEPLTRYERAILFIRPGIFVSYDELQASEPAIFSWTLNTFQKAEIDTNKAFIQVPQQKQRLSVRHLWPEQLQYKQENHRRYPMFTKSMTRFSEAFPEPWNIGVIPSNPSGDLRFLAVMNTFSGDEGDPVKEVNRVINDDTKGAKITTDEGEEIVLFQQYIGKPGRIYGVDIEAQAVSVAVGKGKDSSIRRWLLSSGTELKIKEQILVQTEKPVDIAANYHSGAAAAIFTISKSRAQQLRLSHPAPVFAAWKLSKHDWSSAQKITPQWENGILTLNWDGGEEATIVTNPYRNLSSKLPKFELTLTDSHGETKLPMQTLTAPNGDLVAYVSLEPREFGQYQLNSNRADVSILAQDRWIPKNSKKGEGSIKVSLRPQMELFFRFSPSGAIPEFTANLVESSRGKLVNLLRNGDFEEGIPDYPPRGWSVQRGNRESDEKGWPGWSSEGAYEGEHVLKFVRPKDRITTTSQPMKLDRGGKYVLRFMAKGDAAEAVAWVNGSGSSGRLPIKVSDEWKPYELEVELNPGYTTVAIGISAGGKENQTLWVDAVEFGFIAQ